MSFDTWENELYHHGIKGQKWGFRRWQKSNGSLTVAGRDHYGYGEKQLAKASKYERKAAEYRQSAKNSARANKKAEKYERKAADERSGKALARRKKATKIVAAVGATALVAAGAYVASKGIKKKALNMVDQNANKKISQLMREHDFHAHHISDPSTLNIKRMDFNIRASHALKKADAQKELLRKSTIKALRYAYGR